MRTCYDSVAVHSTRPAPRPVQSYPPPAPLFVRERLGVDLRLRGRRVAVPPNRAGSEDRIDPGTGHIVERDIGSG